MDNLSGKNDNRIALETAMVIVAINALGKFAKNDIEKADKQSKDELCKVLKRLGDVVQQRLDEVSK